MADTSYAEYLRVKARQEAGGGEWVVSFEEWQQQQSGGKAVQVNAGDQAPTGGPPPLNQAEYAAAHPVTDYSPVGGSKIQTWEERLAAGEFAGDEANQTQLEVRRRRNLLTDYHDMKDLPPDVADIVLRDSSGKVRKARSATTQSALGAAFDSKASLFGER